MTNYIQDIFYDTISGMVTRKYGSKFNDAQRKEKIGEVIEQIRTGNVFTIEQTQSIIDKKGFNNFYSVTVNGTPAFKLVKEGFFGKPKVCYFMTRTKGDITAEYLDQVYEEMRQQANGENVFNSSEYKP
ncbi:MAG: hypothetical protein IJ806_11435 [Ruminococcus sp.]|nr:hypothetical protein [Ruminococcus sp.]